jgi:hypothetical protein
MKALLSVSLIAAAMILVAPVWAEEAAIVAIEGEMQCAKCSLQLAGVEKCQDVVVAAAEDGEQTIYWVVKNDAAKQAGHTCEGKKSVRVTGTLAEEDGKSWITAESVELLD